MGKKSRENVGWDGDHTLGQAPILKKFNKILFFLLVNRRNGKAIENSHTQSGVTGVRTPVMASNTSNFGISAS
jgi:hypothetical protein